MDTYQTKKFSNEGVANSEPVKRMNESYQAITPLPTDFNGPVEMIAHNPVKELPVGNGMSDVMPMDNKGTMKSQSASVTEAGTGSHS